VRFVAGPGTATFTRPVRTPDEPKLEAIYEGECPTHRTPLERRDECGWCPTCGLGYALTSTGPGEADLIVTFEFTWAKHG
jgi:hypothetical protein